MIESIGYLSVPHLNPADTTSFERFTVPYYDDDGNEVNPDLIRKPSLCLLCERNYSEDWMEHILCNLTRLDQQDEGEFICHAHIPKRLA